MRLQYSLACLCLLLSTFVKAQEVTIESVKADSNYIVEDSLLIKTSDGAFISALVVRKRNIIEPLPVIFQFTIYARLTDINKVKLAADKGYVGVMAYTRGKRYSPDKEVWAYEYDGRDAYEVIDWISHQYWCNGKVGMMGGSYNGFTQWAATRKLHPALKTIVPSASVAPGLDVPMMNNVFMSFPFSWTYYVSNNKFLDEKDYRGPQWANVQWKWFELGTAYPTLDSLLGRPSPMFQRWLQHPTYDSYWQKMIPYKEDFAQITIPVLTTTGYYDGGQVGALYYMHEHLKYNRKAEHYLVIGPFGHFGSQGFPDSVYGGYKIDPVANIPIHSIIYEWFDYILKGKPKPTFLQDRINYQPMGSNEWKHASSLQAVASDTLKLFLDSQKGGTLTSKKPTKKGYSKLVIDFKDRTQLNSYYYMSKIIYDSLFDGGGLMFKSAPLQQAIEVSGNFTGKMSVTINKKDMDYSIALFEERPDGKFMFLSYFMGRASYVNDITTRQLLQPGKSTQLPFSNSYFTSRQLSKGSRIVIIVNINKSPFEQINYGTGKNVNEETIQDSGDPLQVLWHTESYISLPVSKQ